jgi:Rad3-related DNA helicase
MWMPPRSISQISYDTHFIDASFKARKLAKLCVIPMLSMLVLNRESSHVRSDTHAASAILSSKKELMKHNLDRLYQQQTYEQILNSTAKYIVVEAPVGSGKSAYAAACGEFASLKTMVLTRTKSLQDQYARSYSFSTVKGKGSYACLHNFAPGADLCKIDGRDEKELKEKCESECPYPLACEEMLSSNLASLNYSKFLTELRQSGLVSKYSPDVLFLDEAHQLSDLVCEWSGCTLPWNDYLKQYIQPEYIHPSLPQTVAINKAIDWLAKLMESIADSEPYLGRKPDRKQVEVWRKWDSLRRKVENTLKLVEQEKSTGLYSQSEGILP